MPNSRVFLLALVLSAFSAPSGRSDDVMIQLGLRGQTIEGSPLSWSEQEIVLLGRDGRLWQFPPKEAKDFRKTADRFQGYAPSQYRATLLRELGRGYEVNGTSHYMVAHPDGQEALWPERFEGLYRLFLRYFSVRGLALQEPPFLLVGIVCRDRQEYVRHAARDGGPTARGVLGYYSSLTNRILLYDIGGGEQNQAAWQENAATVIHEATHQMAFNTGLHSRYVPQPLWLVEGLATMFEPIALGSPNPDGSRRERANPSRLRHFLDHVAPRHRPELLADVIANDKFFQVNPLVRMPSPGP